MKKTVTKLNALPNLARKTKVAAYARVSDGKDAMLHSLATQINYYKKLIQDNNEWEFIGVYADEAKTGTKDSRAEFQLLLADCRAGKIDLIITKSISRFARNTVTLLKTIRDLKAINVDVFFEEQNIHSISGEGEMILTFLATFAQEESRSASENMKWRIKKDFEKGIMRGGKDCLGYKLENKRLILIPEEAELVKIIFNLYIEGNGDEQICKILNAKGIKPKHSTRWYRSSIKLILTNFNYTGDLILQKTYRENHLTKKKRVNKGEYDKFLIENDHDSIISKETFYEAQRIRKDRAEKIKPITVKKRNALVGVIRCGICGKAYSHKETPYKKVWICSTYSKIGKSECSSKQVPDSIIKEAVNFILNKTEFDEKNFKLKVESIEVMPNKKLIFHMKEGSSKEYVWSDSRKNSWTPEMREQARIRTLNQKRGENLNA